MCRTRKRSPSNATTQTAADLSLAMIIADAILENITIPSPMAKTTFLKPLRICPHTECAHIARRKVFDVGWAEGLANFTHCYIAGIHGQTKLYSLTIWRSNYGGDLMI